MSEYNPFEDSMPGKGLHEINNAPKEGSASVAEAPPANPPYVPPPNPPYEPYIPPAAPGQSLDGSSSYPPMSPPPGMIPPNSSVHYAPGANAGAYGAAPAVRYDLAGNPLPVEASAAPPPPSAYGGPPPAYGAPPSYGGSQPGYGGAPQYGAPQAPYGAPQGAWPPPPGHTGSALYNMQEMNTSGQQGAVPAEIDRLRWNWGAYFLPVLWCRWHGMTSLAGVLAATSFGFRLLRIMPSPMHYVFYALYSIFWFCVSIYMGLNGHKMAWRNRRYFGGVEEHLKVQRAWMLGGVFAGPVLLIAFGVFLVSVAIASRPSTPTYTPSTYNYNNPAGGGYSDGGSAGAPVPAGENAPADPSASPGYNGPAAGAPNDGPTAPVPASSVDSSAPSGFHPN